MYPEPQPGCAALRSDAARTRRRRALREQGDPQQKQFEQAYDTIKKKALGWTAVPEKYRSQVKAGFGLWIDNNWRKKGWDVTDFSKGITMSMNDLTIAGISQVTPLPPASLSSRPTALARATALRRRWLLAFSAGVICAGLAAIATWILLPNPRYTPVR